METFLWPLDASSPVMSFPSNCLVTNPHNQSQCIDVDINWHLLAKKTKEVLQNNCKVIADHLLTFHFIECQKMVCEICQVSVGFLNICVDVIDMNSIVTSLQPCSEKVTGISGAQSSALCYYSAQPAR